MSETEEPATSEAEALAEILTWSEDRPPWQRDALRRLIEKEDLREDDLADLTSLCKDSSRPATPLARDHIRAPDAGAPSIQLCALQDVLNVNALAGEQRLTFAPNGITGVYGDNGSGKSGYVRILKRACRARGRNTSILENIYTQPIGSQQARIDFITGGQNQSEHWRESEPSTPLLSGISVFDTRSANIHVDEANELAYTPFPMRLLERLVRTCREIKARIDEKISSLEAQTPGSLRKPECNSNTAVGTLISGLSESTSPGDVTALGTITDEEQARIQTLHSELAQAPSAATQQMQPKLDRLDNLIECTQTLARAVSDESTATLQRLAQDFSTKQEAVRAAAQDLFADEPLPSIGGATWERLWEAARAYSVEAAYPDQSFPVTNQDARCVLCLQPLSPEASERLRSFDAFVQDRTQQERDAAKRVLDQQIATLRQAGLTISDMHAYLRFLREEMGLTTLAGKMRVFLVQANWRLRRLQRHYDPGTTLASQIPETKLQAARNDLQDRIQALLAEEQSEQRQALKHELQELTDRQWLERVREDVLGEIERKKESAGLHAAKRDTNHQQISNKSSMLAEGLVTNRLRGRFAQEVARLNVAGLAVELQKTRTQHGVPHFRVSLIHKPDEKAGEILSEGEHRCVALAAFLAELATTDSRSGIVLDDPISSLDHLHREDVAARLAKEAHDRQIIVFTHDLPFLFLLRRACDEQCADLVERHVFRRNHEPGHADNKAPIRAQEPETRLGSLETHLNNARIQYDRDLEDQWIFTAKGLLGHIRDTWEAAVESAVGPVLRTFQSKVNTSGLVRLSVITKQDASEMRGAYSRVSSLLHNTSDAMNPRAPTPDQIADEIATLRAWITDLRGRQNAVNT